MYDLAYDVLERGYCASIDEAKLAAAASLSVVVRKTAADARAAYEAAAQEEAAA